MSEAARAMSVAEPLRVAVIAADPRRRAELGATVAGFGHRIVEDSADADVVLALDAAPGEGRPVVALGGADTDQAGLLARDASAAQIDAALRAAAAGLIVRARARHRLRGAGRNQLERHAHPARDRSAQRHRRRPRQQGDRPQARHLAAHGEIPHRVDLPQTRRPLPSRGGGERAGAREPLSLRARRRSRF